MTSVAPERVSTVLERRPLNLLIDDFIHTGKMIDGLRAAHDSNLVAEYIMVRGWIMDELEARNQDAYEAWLMSSDNTDESIRKYY